MLNNSDQKLTPWSRVGPLNLASGALLMAACMALVFWG